jgi:ABC-type hemin transport system ATPase subunit
MEPCVLLADEVVGGFDPWKQRDALTIFDKLARRGTAVVLATHDLDLARRWPDLVVVMARGGVVATDMPERIFADATVRGVLGPLEFWNDR